ncbi:Importin subunit alpha-3 [Armadillidium vulgare]|nr:Importin subunit alpha-3 [Armadillidium vulgare]
MHHDNEISEEIKSIGDELESEEEATRLKGIERTRKHLIEEDNPLFESYYEEGIIPPLIACLSSQSCALQLEAASAITSIVSQKSKYANAVYDVIPLLIKLLSSSDDCVVIESAAALGSLAEKSIFICGKIIELGAIEPLHTVVQNTDSVSISFRIFHTFCSLYLPFRQTLLFAINIQVDSLRTLSKTTRTITSHKSLSLPQEDIEALVNDAKKFLLSEDEEVYCKS